MTDYDFQVLALGAFGYALGQESYFVSNLVDVLIRNVDKIDPITKQYFEIEILSAIENGQAGTNSDIEYWLDLVSALQENR